MSKNVKLTSLGTDLRFGFEMCNSQVLGTDLRFGFGMCNISGTGGSCTNWARRCWLRSRSCCREELCCAGVIHHFPVAVTDPCWWPHVHITSLTEQADLVDHVNRNRRINYDELGRQYNIVVDPPTSPRYWRSNERVFLLTQGEFSCCVVSQFRCFDHCLIHDTKGDLLWTNRTIEGRRCVFSIQE